MAFIRRYKTSDFEAVIHVFRETAAPELRTAGDAALHPASFIWCRPYLMLSSLSPPIADCFVLDDGHGKAVGYIIGTANTIEYVKQYRNIYLPYIESKERITLLKPGQNIDGKPENMTNALLHTVYSPEHMLHGEEAPDLMDQYPAHLHIDILPSHQKHGYGRSMIQKFCDTIQNESGAKGVHLVMSAHNVEAGKFYAKIGFDRYPQVIDGGKSGEVGKQIDGSLWQVKRFPIVASSISSKVQYIGQ